MAERVLVGASEAAPQLKRVVEPSPDEALRLLCWIGAGLAVAGWLDVLLLWIPLHFGRPEWEFGTVSATFDALPLGTIGAAILIAAAVARGWRRAVLVGGVAALVMALVLVAALVLYALDLPLAWKGVAESYRPTLEKAMFKTGALALIYIAMYSTTGLWVLRRIKRGERSQTRSTVS